MFTVDSEALNTRPSVQLNSFGIGGAFVLFNLFLMSFVCVYWTNTAVHQYFSGRPL
ncbi:hypothetical protein EV06_1363 [Prochlorococcus sp. MIT 0602]|nr:hypothetical protein EV06_1363 [Prochlorococcus sp. MIT 0602]